MMFSAGMPILYFFAALFYFLFYWIYKVLLLKFYSRTTRFNEVIPQYSMQFIKFGLLMHGLTSLVILSNSDLMYSDKEQEQLESEIAELSRDSIVGRLYARYYFKEYMLSYIAFWAIVIMCYIFQKTLIATISRLIRLCKNNKLEQVSP